MKKVLQTWWFWLIVAVTAAVVMGVTAALLLLPKNPGKTDKDPAPQTPPVTQQELPPPEKTELTPEDFQWGENGYLTCTAAPTRLGVDVSSFQGDVDWAAVKSAGMEFAMIRVAGRGYGATGVLYEDKNARANYQNAKAAGLDVGVYFFSQAISVEEARQEAEYLLQIIRDWQLEMPVVYDWEFMGANTRTADVSARTLTDCIKTFCDTVEQAGFESMVYFNPDHSTGMFHIAEITQYDFWLAMYTDWMTYPYKVDMWQYTNKGTVPGIAGQVDINIYFPEEVA